MLKLRDFRAKKIQYLLAYTILKLRAFSYSGSISEVALILLLTIASYWENVTERQIGSRQFWKNRL